ncbi:MAG: M48 family metalloprotease [Alphaproteobacteria bacterium]
MPTDSSLSRRHFCRLTGSAMALGLSGCALNPATGQRDFMLVSRGGEKKIGAEEHPKVLKAFGGVYNDARITAYVTWLGGRLAAATETPGLGFTFTVLDSPVVNAFALPGGYVYISRGLMALAGSEAELAGVLGHELGHVVARHGAQRASKAAVAGLLGVGRVGQALGGLYLRGFSRDQELEADRLGVRYLKRAGYDPGAVSSFLAKMQANGRLQAKIVGLPPGEVDEFDIMSTHPRTARRVRQAIAQAGAAAGQGVLERQSYLSRIDNMMYGDSPGQGFVRGRAFLHPGLRLGFEVPEGFRLRNSPGKVGASNPDGIVIVFDAADEPHEGAMSAYLSDVWGKHRKLTDLKSITVNGLRAASAHTTLDTPSGRLTLRIAAIRADANHIFRFIVAATGKSGKNLDGVFTRTVYSFRRLGKAEAAAIRPWRLRVIRARPGDTAYGLGRRMPFSDFQTERFEVLNGLFDNRVLAAGTRVKLVSE